MYFPIQYVLALSMPTRITAHSATLIDNIFTNHLTQNLFSGIIINDLSDHLPVFIGIASVMADGCTLLSSTKNSYSHSNDWNFKEILKQKASSNLVYQDKRIGWIGSYELLRNFVECVVKLNGKWTSPGGSAKKFTCCSMDLSITWYPGKQNSLILHGEESLAVREMLINVCKLLTNGE